MFTKVFNMGGNGDGEGAFDMDMGDVQRMFGGNMQEMLQKAMKDGGASMQDGEIDLQIDDDMMEKLQDGGTFNFELDPDTVEGLQKKMNSDGTFELNMEDLMQSMQGGSKGGRNKAKGGERRTPTSRSGKSFGGSRKHAGHR